jgi:hypothetical protein
MGKLEKNILTTLKILCCEQKFRGRLLSFLLLKLCLPEKVWQEGLWGVKYGLLIGRDLLWSD